MQNQKRLYVINTLANLIGNIVLVVLFLVTTPVLINTLGDVQYGLFRVALVSIVGYSMLLGLGFGSAVQRFFSDAIYNDNSQRANEVLSVAYSLYIVQTIIALLIITSSVFWLPPLVNTPPEFLQAFRTLLIIAGIYVSSLFLLNPLKAVLVSHSRYDLHQIAEQSFRFILFVGGIALIYLWEPSLYCLAISALAGIAVKIILTIGFARKIFPDLHLLWEYKDNELRKAIFRFGKYSLMMFVGMLVMYQSQDVLIAAFLGPRWVAAYAVAAVLIVQIRAVSDALASPLFPIASKLKAQNNNLALQKLMLEGTRRCLWAWGALACPVLVYSDSFIAAWIGSQYASSYVFVWILLAGDLAMTLQYCPSHILNAVGSIKWLGYSQLIAAAVSLVCMIGVLKLSSLALTGMAISVALPMVIRGGIVVPIYASRQLRMPLKRFFAYNLIPLLGYLVFGIGLSWMLRVWLHPLSLGTILFVMGAVAAAIATSGLWLVFSRQERNDLFSLAKENITWLRSLI